MLTQIPDTHGNAPFNDDSPSEARRTKTSAAITFQHPRGWDSNPSSLRERAVVGGLIIASLAFAPSTTLVYLPAVLAVAGLLTIIGSARRWKTNPWLVTSIGLLLGPATLTGIARALIPMAIAGRWPLAEIFQIATALAATGAAMDEVLASLQFVREQARGGRSPWRAFWGLSPRPRRRGRAIKTT